VTPYATLAPLYGALLGDRFFPSLRRSFEGLVRRYGIRFASAADVACGTGTFVRYLRERGVPIVYGVDRSPEMLRVAIAKNQGTGTCFLLQHLAPLQLPQPVDLITCHFDSLNYPLTSDDLLRVLRRFHANMNPGGHLIFDMITDRPPWQEPEPRVERVISSGVTVVRVTLLDTRGVQTAHISISRNGRSPREIHVQQGHPVAVVVDLLAQALFALLGAHDFQTLGPAATWTPRAVYVARVGQNRTSPLYTRFTPTRTRCPPNVSVVVSEPAGKAPAVSAAASVSCRI
jgi:SAM-dependent methyltransferase